LKLKENTVAVEFLNLTVLDIEVGDTSNNEWSIMIREVVYQKRKMVCARRVHFSKFFKLSKTSGCLSQQFSSPQ
jgi:hypothetical protein